MIVAMVTPASSIIQYFYGSRDCEFVTVLVRYFKGKKERQNNSTLLHSVVFCSHCACAVVTFLPEESFYSSGWQYSP